jgi:hypothetical protein
MNNTLKNRLQYHVTGAIERGEAQAIVEIPALHTLSPWHLHKSDSDFVIVHSDGENVSRIAKLFDSTLCEEHGSLTANAQLIASAPDLLSALDWALRQIEDDLDPDHQAAFDAAHSTLRKAKGEA